VPVPAQLKEDVQIVESELREIKSGLAVRRVETVE
jgi:hypothetical protein